MTESSITQYAKVFTRGFGQIMLQPSAATGLLFLMGIAVNSVVMFCGAILGALTGNLGAKLFKFDAKEIASGLYGFNGALVGIAVLFFYEPAVLTVCLIAIGGVLSSILMRALLGWKKLPPFTAPFVLAGWVVLLLANVSGVTANTLSSTVEANGELYAVARGVGQVMFQGYWASGVLFVLGLFFHSKQAATWGLIGSALGTIIGSGFGYPQELVALGLYGFNACLVGIAVSSKFRSDALAPLAGIVLSVLITRGFQLTPVPPLTAPFVLATWVVLLAYRVREVEVHE